MQFLYWYYHLFNLYMSLLTFLDFFLIAFWISSSSFSTLLILFTAVIFLLSFSAVTLPMSVWSMVTCMGSPVNMSTSIAQFSCLLGVPLPLAGVPYPLLQGDSYTRELVSTSMEYFILVVPLLVSKIVSLF